tara:strand:- start:3554 stop:3973 length:420 start_codon:yes stop_codon:yes gene_type:complete
MPHRSTGHLNYISNSNLDYNNPMNVRRVGAFAGLAYNEMGGLSISPQMGGLSISPQMGGLSISPQMGSLAHNMGGIVETAQSEVMEKPLLYAGLAMLAYAPVKAQVSKKKVSKKAQKQLNMAGIASIVAHYVMPMISGE